MDQQREYQTIDQALDAFLEEQRQRLSERTWRQYRDVIDLYRDCLEGYWPGHDDDYDEVTGRGGTYCGTYGPEDLAEGLDEFLGYFIPRKVIAGREFMRAAGTVTKRLVQWLRAHGYAEDTEGQMDAAIETARALPACAEVLDLLTDYLDRHAPARYTDELEGHFWINRVEPGRLWLDPLLSATGVVGPIPVPEAISARCQVGWDIGGVIGRTARGWRLVEVWNVSP